MRLTHAGRAVVAAFVCAGLASCGSGSSSPTGTTATPMIQMTSSNSGDGQSGTVAAALPNPLRVLVTVNGAPQAGDSVTWATAGTGASVSPARSATDASGIANTTWTLGHAAGAQGATAALGGATGSPVTFTATATAGAAASLASAGGNNQTDTPGSTLPTPLSVLAADAYSNPVAGVGVAWQVTGGSATLGTATDSTGANGTAQTTVTLGAGTGPITIAATSTGLAGSPVTFDETSTAAVATDTVDVGSPYYYKSVRNGSENPAVDTIPAGGRILWVWVASENHGVQSTGSPSFASGAIQSSGTYAVTFPTAGTYTYDCLVHGTLMTGRVVVQ